ncbi:hypothetical protein NL676_031899 [Syzygium grande]|nr:hypothetical protein NL676_031899 [Syzygium grande]
MLRASMDKFVFTGERRRKLRPSFGIRSEISRVRVIPARFRPPPKREEPSGSALGTTGPTPLDRGGPHTEGDPRHRRPPGRPRQHPQLAVKSDAGGERAIQGGAGGGGRAARDVDAANRGGVWGWGGQSGR